MPSPVVESDMTSLPVLPFASDQLGATVSFDPNEHKNLLVSGSRGSGILTRLADAALDAGYPVIYFGRGHDADGHGSLAAHGAIVVSTLADAYTAFVETPELSAHTVVIIDGYETLLLTSDIDEGHDNLRADVLHEISLLAAEPVATLILGAEYDPDIAIQHLDGDSMARLAVGADSYRALRRPETAEDYTESDGARRGIYETETSTTVVTFWDEGRG